MDRRLFLIVILFICNIMTITFLYSQDRTGANFLKIGVGPRQVGLGSSFTGVGDDIYTLYWNPAGIGFIRRWEFSAAFNQYLTDMYYAAISGVKQYRMLGSRKTGFGAGLFFHGMPDWDNTGGIDPEKGSAYNLYGLISFGQQMDWLLSNFSLGMNAKIGYSKLANYGAWLIASDFGAMYRFDVWDKPFTIGLTTQNVGFQTAFIKDRTPIPFGVRGGVSYRIFGCPLHYLLIASDISKYKSSRLRIGFGAEYWFYGIVSVRGGYNYSQDALGDFSLGTSIRLDRFKYGTQLDFNRTDYGEVLGDKTSGAFSLNDVKPEPFRLLSPDNGHVFCYDKLKELKWEIAPDPDRCDIVTYRVLIDPNIDSLRHNLDKICHNSNKKSHVYCDLQTNDPYIQLTRIDPNKYFWGVIAVDRNGHTRPSENIRSFLTSAPDLIIRELAYMPSDTLPDFDDNYQGYIKIILENTGDCTGYDFYVSLSDSYCCNVGNIPFDEFHVDSIKPHQTIRKDIVWQTDEIGKYLFSAVIDPDNRVVELSKNNNHKTCPAVTIPRGRIFAEKDTLETKKIEYNYLEMPIMPVVFFDYQSDEVNKDFYRFDWIHRIPMLKVIADRLKQNKTLKIKLAGYIDSYNEKDGDKLARNRMQNVYSIFTDTLGVSSDQVILMNNYDVTKRRVDRTPEEMVNEENRRVEIYSDNLTPAEEFELFGPLVLNESEMTENARIADRLGFNSEIKAYIDINYSLLIISDPEKAEIENVIFRTPFMNEPTFSRLDLAGRASWDGRDNENRLVELNRPYFYSLKVQDKLGREFEATPKYFYIKYDLREIRQLQVHLNIFDSANDYFSFNKNRLNELVKKLCLNSPSSKFRVEGFSCEIGKHDYNLNLSHFRSKSFRERFLEIAKQICPDNECYQECEQRALEVLSKEELTKKGTFNQPLKYYRPCTLGEIIYSNNNAYIRNLNRRVELILFDEEAREVAQEFNKVKP